MDRSEFFQTLLSRGNGSARTGRFSGIQPYTGQWTANEVAHLLKRTMFGATKQDIDHFLATGMNNAVDELLATITPPAPPVRDYGFIETEDGTYDDLGVVQGSTWVNDPNLLSDADARPGITRARMDSLRKWWAGLMINQQRSIQEKMVLFWHHHFSVQQEEVNDPQMMYRHHHLLRSNMLGNVKTLAKEVTTDPAMLVHLNGYLNSKQAADENYSREFQELFTIGLGNDSHFTENDVIAAARVLTGWRVRTEPLESYADLAAHDNGSKSFSSFYGNRTITGSAPLAELNELVDMVFDTEEAAKFFVRKIYRFFVYYEIDAAVETAVIEPLASILRSSGYEIKPMLETLFKSGHFYDQLNQACFIKTPLDILVGTLREFNVTFPPYTDYVAGYPLFFSIYKNAANMQLDLFQPPDVNGYAAFVQGPMHYELWVNSNSLPRRADYTNALVADGVIDVRSFVSLFSAPENPDLLVNDVTNLLLRYPLSAASKNFVKTTFLLNNTSDNNVWTAAWNSNNSMVIDTSLKKMFTFLMNLPEFHLC